MKKLPKGIGQGALILRADVNSKIGMGHVMRCLALAQAWQDSGESVKFLMIPGAPSLEKRLMSERIKTVHILAQPGSSDDADQTASLAQNSSASWIVVDGYHFDAEYQRIIKNSGQRLLVIDDNGHANHYYADCVLNQNLQAAQSFYASREPYTRLLLGRRYSLLRREFLTWRGFERELPEVGRKILVTLGGGDPDNGTLKVIKALQQVNIDRLEIVIAVGGSNPHFQELQAAIRESTVPIRLENNVRNMPELMAWADVAIAAAGITAWELAFMGVPSFFLIQAENQRETAERLEALGVARNLGRLADLSCDELAHALINLLVAAERRAEMVHRGRELVDGNGATRVLMHLNADRLYIRRARECDCEQLWEWANDRDVRAVSFSPEPISWEKHVEWFRSKLNNPTCVLHIATNGAEIPVGEIRYDLDGDQAVVSITVDREFRGKGYGSVLIRRSAQAFFESAAVTTVHAYIKQANVISVHAFENAGYQDVGTAIVEGHEARHLALSRDGKNAR